MCHYSCKTCSGPNNNNCLTCIEGHVYDSSAKTCATFNDTYKLLFDENGAHSNGTLGSPVVTDGADATWTASSPETSTGGCPSGDYKIGYYGYTSSSQSNFGKAKIKYEITQAQIDAVHSNHYGFHFKATLLFIDFWPNGIKMNFRSNGQGVHTYVYDMEDIIGEELCGRSFHDHHEVVEFTFLHTDLPEDVYIEIECTDLGYQWGIKDVVVGLLICDSFCEQCTGPGTAECTSCPANQILEGSDCVCDSDSGYYNDTDGTCKTNCSGGYYADSITHSCVD